ncbi:MAG: diacylglycerol/lipid kinase family protein [Eubacterium sp.]
MEYHFIINPNSKSGKGIKLWRRTKLILDSNNINYTSYITAKPGDATLAANNISQNDSTDKRIIILGGDGTLNEVINGISSFDNITFGIIPTGSGNDFIRDMQFPKNFKEQVMSIINPTEFDWLDYGICRINDKEHRFVVSSGIGYDAFVCEGANYSNTKKFLNKLHLGKLSYTIIGVTQMLKLHRCNAKMTFNNLEEVQLKGMLFVSAHIHKYEGGGFKFCPDADASDGLLDICAVEHIPKLKMLSLFPFAAKGKHIGHNGINTYKCKQLDISCDSPMAVHTDGETWEQCTNISFYNSQKKMHFIIR